MIIILLHIYIKTSLFRNRTVNSITMRVLTALIFILLVTETVGWIHLFFGWGGKTINVTEREEQLEKDRYNRWKATYTTTTAPTRPGYWEGGQWKLGYQDKGKEALKAMKKKFANLWEKMKAFGSTIADVGEEYVMRFWILFALLGILVIYIIISGIYCCLPIGPLRCLCNTLCFCCSFCCSVESCLGVRARKVGEKDVEESKVQEDKEEEDKLEEEEEESGSSV